MTEVREPVREPFGPKTPSISLARFEARRAKLAPEFRAASPFPHIVLEEFLTVDPARVDNFPDVS